MRKKRKDRRPFCGAVDYHGLLGATAGTPCASLSISTSAHSTGFRETDSRQTCRTTAQSWELIIVHVGELGDRRQGLHRRWAAAPPSAAVRVLAGLLLLLCPLRFEQQLLVDFVESTHGVRRLLGDVLRHREDFSQQRLRALAGRLLHDARHLELRWHDHFPRTALLGGRPRLHALGGHVREGLDLLVAQRRLP
eukprot:scaffold1960_cov242-Pinguiococcus_pyrenoidosus.AAC.20